MDENHLQLENMRNNILPEIKERVNQQQKDADRSKELTQLKTENNYLPVNKLVHMPKKNKFIQFKKNAQSKI